LFRSIAFKHGIFVEVDANTKSMLRVDVARIKIVSSKLSFIDASMTVKVLGKEFVIKVIEEGWGYDEGERMNGCKCAGWREGGSSRGSVDGGSVMAVVEGTEDGGSDDDWSEEGQVLLGVGRQMVRKGHVENLRKNVDQVCLVSDTEPNVLGKTLGGEQILVNSALGDGLEASDILKGEGDVSTKVAGSQKHEVVRSVENVMCCPLNGSKEIEYVRFEVGPAQEDTCGVIGPLSNGPLILRTKEKDIYLAKPSNGNITGGADITHDFEGNLSVGCSLGPTSKNNSSDSIEVTSGYHEGGEKFHALPRHRKSKTRRSSNIFHPYNKFRKFQECIQRKGAAMKKKSKKGGGSKVGDESSTASDPIQNSRGEIVTSEGRTDQKLHSYGSEGIELEVVLPSLGGGEKEVSDNPLVRSADVVIQRGQVSGVEELVEEGLEVRIESPISGGRCVDREAINAHHIIDIQEDLGLRHYGPADDKVRRIMEMEERDCREKQEWEQNSYQ
jgi:hypothetical protein